MIISKTPFRISFFGGGTDYPEWYLKEEGAVLSTTIDKYCYISCRILPPFFNHKYRIVWSQVENVSTLSEIIHPVVREGLRFLGMDNGIGLEIQYQGDLPARAGMGSSSAFSVGLIQALTALQGKIIDKYSLALKAIELEQSILKENVGSQDQIATSHGGINVVRFFPNEKIRIEPVALSVDRIVELESYLMLIYTGTSRFASEVAGDVIANFSEKQAPLRQMRDMVDEALSILNSNTDIVHFGEILHRSWMLKRSISDSISNTTIDNIYETARAHGAIGGKLLGAGASGFMLFVVPPNKQQNVNNALSDYIHVPFKFEDEGCRTIYYTPN